MGLQAPKSLDISHRRKNASLLPFNLHLLEIHIAHSAFSSAISNWNLPFNPCFLCMLKLKGSTQCFQASTHLQCLQRSHGKCHARWWGTSRCGEPVPIPRGTWHHMWPIWATILGLLPRPTQNHWPFQAGDTQIQLLGPALLQSRVPIMDLAWEVSWTCHLPAVIGPHYCGTWPAEEEPWGAGWHQDHGQQQDHAGGHKNVGMKKCELRKSFACDSDNVVFCSLLWWAPIWAL